MSHASLQRGCLPMIDHRPPTTIWCFARCPPAKKR